MARVQGMPSNIFKAPPPNEKLIFSRLIMANVLFCDVVGFHV